MMNSNHENYLNNENTILTQKIIQLSMKVHSCLGPGLLESSYETCLEIELKRIGLHVERQLSLPIFYFEEKIEAGYRIDLMVEKEIIVEVKSVEKIISLHQA